MHTKDLIEKNGYSVIYGDTDSVMINTGFSERSELQRVKKLGNDVSICCQIQFFDFFVRHGCL